MDQSVQLLDLDIQKITEDPVLREALALCAYGADLFHRMQGGTVGPAALVLWRSFAWLPSGSPKKKFVLSADLILRARDAINQRILAAARVS